MRDHSELTTLLADWLPRQRWFAGKGRADARVGIVQDVPVSDRLRHLIVEVAYSDGGPRDLYQVPLVIRPDAPHGHSGFLLGEMSTGLVYDGLHDADGSAALLDFLSAGQRHGTLAAHAVTPLSQLPAHSVGAEQSNTSIVYGEEYILKVFRRLWPGVNPDLEVTRALAAAGTRHVASPLAWLDGELPGAGEGGSDADTTFAFMQEYLRSGTEGWKLAITSVRDLYAEGDLPPDEVGGDFAGESERLGAATAEVHTLLAGCFPTAAVDPESLHTTALGLHGRLDAALTAVPELAPYEGGARAAYDALAAETAAAPYQRIHGDLHLGQVLRTENGWVLFDFEGEPARPVPERRRLDSPLRDIAGMLRSFDYAAQSMLLERADEPGLAYRAREWAERNRVAFLDGYQAASGLDLAAHAVELRAYELDKAVYEVLYEARHRPSWVDIPLGAVRRLTALQPPLPTGSAAA
ncbi:phosphotransferase [Frankia sp. AgB1.9]|uniref:maltokinase N-terminal cap-like domain-containing protein n=1 Tax=unclassified Frankia TaxID=2632575 RepID=UPI001933AF08|nr:MULTISPECIES: phosphotransferase [unclassified Frankia]MBL7492955.1 phosphotransferase [Frankia sp. AgW1.1]MBL7549926.1 phosphotransferase [Frankia sp. AgB1.9]MBL7620470.1 phosphotransferase [Frankia sp. AgB1.8]